MSTDMTPVEDMDESDLSLTGLVDMVRTMALENARIGGTPRPVAAGTFALYAMEDGGIMFVTDVPDGPLAGVKYNRIKPGMIRALGALAGGGSPMGKVKALMGRPRRGQ